MKHLIFILMTLLTFNAIAHEGHGAPPTDPSKFGGQLSNVVDYNKMTKREKNNPAVYKSELIRSEDGTLRFYIFDLKMKAIDLSSFPSKIDGNAENTKNKINLSFQLEKHGDHYMGKMPKITKRPFNLYFKIPNKDKILFSGYDNLD